MNGRRGPEARPVMAVGTGRCGTHFLTALFQQEGDVLALHESDPLNEAFHRYCRWNRLPVDDAGFLDIKSREIEAAQRTGKLFFEASAYLSLSIRLLFDAFAPRFILITRDPVDTVNSLWSKGWYEAPYRKSLSAAAVGYHAIGAPHHFFSRPVPCGSKFDDWQALCRIGKLGWYWSMLNREVLAQFEQLPKDSWTVVSLEQLDHNAYLRLAAFAGIEPKLSAAQFRRIADKRPGALPGQRPLWSWSAIELEAFAGQVANVAQRLGYATGFAARWRQARDAMREAHA